MFLVDLLRAELADWGVPVVLMMMTIPFVSGLATGLAIGFVGASFPIVFSMLGGDPSLGQVLAATVLAYGFGYMGMILSPVHVCLIVTNEHFGTRLQSSLRVLARPAVAMLPAVVVLYFAILWLFGS